MRPPPLWFLVALTSIGALSLNVFVPSIPGLVVYFESDLATVQLALSLYLVGIAAGQLLHGPLSDQFGRRPVLLAGLALYAGASLLCAVAPSVELLVAGRVLQALGACAGMVLSRAIVRDVWGRDDAARALGYLSAVVSVVPALAPAIGGYLEIWFSWRASFIAVLAFGAVVLALALAFAHETNQWRRPAGWRALASGYATLLRSRAFLGYAVNVSLSSGSFFAFIAGAPVLMGDVLGYPPNECGIWFISTSVTYMLGNLLAGRFSPRIGIDRMIWAGCGLSTAAGALAVLLAVAAPLDAMTLFGPMSLIAIGNGMSQPNGTAGAISAEPGIAGAAAGLLGFLQMGSGALGTFLVGHFEGRTLLPLAAIMAGSLLLALLALATTRRARRASA